MDHKLILMILLCIALASVTFYSLYIGLDKEIKPIPTEQYTKPIGPTQEYPNILDSKLKEGIPLVKR